MLRFSVGITELDRVKNEHNQRQYPGKQFGEKVRESRFKFGHVHRGDEE